MGTAFQEAQAWPVLGLKIWPLELQAGPLWHNVIFEMEGSGLATMPNISVVSV